MLTNDGQPAMSGRQVTRWSTGLLLLVALAVPNVPYVVASMIGIGTPPRTAGILLYVLAAVMGRVFSRSILLAALTVAFAADVTITTASLFGFYLGDLPKTLQFASEVNFFAGRFFVALAITVVVNVMAMVMVAWHGHQRLRHGSLGILVIGTLSVVAVDYYANRDPHYGIGRVMAGNRPVRSALRESGLEAEMLRDVPRHRVLVIVEGLGVHIDRDQHQTLLAPLVAAAARNDRTVTWGIIPYYGATKEAELRELCSTRQVFTDFLSTPDSSCIPFRLTAKGYHTTGMHGYTGSMFRRSGWWKNIGFTTLVFRDSLSALPRCGKAFSGVCDTAMVADLGARLQAASQPEFLYFLTLNTHLPITPLNSVASRRCGGQEWLGRDNVCELDEIWQSLFRNVAALIDRPDIPAFDLLIVGDHAPPLWSRRERRRFEAGVVPWIRIAPS